MAHSSESHGTLDQSAEEHNRLSGLESMISLARKFPDAYASIKGGRLAELLEAEAEVASRRASLAEAAEREKALRSAYDQMNDALLQANDLIAEQRTRAEATESKLAEAAEKARGRALEALQATLSETGK